MASPFHHNSYASAPIGVVHSYKGGWGSYSWACLSLTHKEHHAFYVRQRLVVDAELKTINRVWVTRI